MGTSEDRLYEERARTVAIDDGRPEHEGIGAAVKQLSEDLGILVRKEMELARREMTAKLQSAGVGAGMLGGSALTAS
jgi:hypothetical protein